ncbi:serine/threonine protein kinase [Duganella sp. Leaf126]|uniref:serine/threonine protein kinase n=1 Tax=Duganella sp. Leaf126 TaxID=1736266 RepID=UPI0012E1B726|nr:serine/threonine protein kinase [Duganella sp. Leaf126]
MSDNVTWIVDLDASLEDAPNLAERVKIWLIAQGVVSATPCQAPGAENLLSRGPSAAAWDAYLHTSPVLMCGLEVTTQRQVFHTGDNGIDSIRCPDCSVRRNPDDLPWSDAVGAWFEDNGNYCMKCPDCGASRSIVEWEFDHPWGFGNLAFGFWNWPIADRMMVEISAITGNRCRLVHEHI